MNPNAFLISGSRKCGVSGSIWAKIPVYGAGAGAGATDTFAFGTSFTAPALALALGLNSR
jgi:hypothetical protein